jgi:hypothetical protein
MKRNILLLLSLLMATCALAQNKGYGSLSRGIVIPIGKFASKDFANNGGAAKVGSNIDFSFVYGAPDKVGFALVMRYQTNRTDKEGILDSFKKRDPYSRSVNSDNWNFAIVMLGIRKSYKMNDILDIEAKFTGGVSRCYLPFVSVRESNEYYARYMSSATSWATMFGLGANLVITPNVYVQTKVDIMATMPKFKDIQLYHEELYTPFDEEYHQLILSTSACIGLGLKF